jgi:hypothetical protein
MVVALATLLPVIAGLLCSDWRRQKIVSGVALEDGLRQREEWKVAVLLINQDSD